MQRKFVTHLTFTNLLSCCLHLFDRKLGMFPKKLQPINMSCKIVLHKPLDDKFANCALRNVVGKRGRKDIEDVGKTPKNCF